MEHRQSLFERLIGNPAHPWLTLGAAILFALVPFAGLVLSADPDLVLASGRWRGLFVAPIVIIYIVVVSRVLGRAGVQVLNALRPVVMVPDETFDHLVERANTFTLRYELLAFATGLVLGLIRVGPSAATMESWHDVYLLLSTGLMYGLLAWAIYVSVASSRATGALLSQPMSIDPTEISAFEPIGRQSLMLALVFIGGITLSLLFSAADPGVFGDIGFWMLYLPIALVPIAVFYLAMHPTHQILAAAKWSELKIVRGQLRQASARLQERLAQNEDTFTVTQQITALAVLEQRLQLARTWPYNTTMLRTLFVSALVPGVTLLVRTLLERFVL